MHEDKSSFTQSFLRTKYQTYFHEREREFFQKYTPIDVISTQLSITYPTQIL